MKTSCLFLAVILPILLVSQSFAYYLGHMCVPVDPVYCATSGGRLVWEGPCQTCLYNADCPPLACRPECYEDLNVAWAPIGACPHCVC